MSGKRDYRIEETYRFYDPEIVSRVDPEVAGEYAENRDPKILKLPPEAKPVLFRFRVLKRSQRNRIMEISNSKTQLLAAFRFGILEIRDIPAGHGEYTSWVPQRRKTHDQIDDDGMDTLEEMGFGDTDFWEVGTVIVGHSFLAHGAPVYCPQLPSSQLVWAATRSRSLAAQRTEEETQTDDSSS